MYSGIEDATLGFVVEVRFFLELFAMSLAGVIPPVKKLPLVVPPLHQETDDRLLFAAVAVASVHGLASCNYRLFGYCLTPVTLTGCLGLGEKD
jgi:hypothetical protein